MRPTLRTLLPIAAGLGAVLTAADARATSCAAVSECQSGLIASRDTLSVPLNAELRFIRRNQPPLTPVAEDAPEVSFDCNELADRAGPVIACRANGLQPNRSYTLPALAITLETTAELDTTPPSAPDGLIARWDAGEGEEESLVPSWRGVRVLVAAAEDPSALTLEIGVTTPGGEERIFATTGQLGGQVGGLSTFIGVGLCHCNPVLHAEELPEGSSVRVRFVDAAGQVGPWTEKLSPDNADVLDGGCTCTAPIGAAPGAILLLLPLLVIRSRSTR